MGRRRGDTVVARFTSFGTTAVARGSNESAVELTRFGPGRPGPVTLISPTSLEHFPPLNRAPLFFDTPGSPPPPVRKQVNGAGVPTGRLTDDTLDAGSDASSHKQRHAGGWSAVAASQRPTIEVLQGQLADANHRCYQLQQQLDSYAKASAHQAAQQAVSPAGKVVMNNKSKQVSELETEFAQYKHTAESRMSDIQQEVLTLLACFQQQGYEVAAGLDNLQDDLIELEHAGETHQHRQARQQAAVSGDDPSTPPTTPYPTSPQGGRLEPPTPTSVSPNTEKLVVLRARREHVETAFLEMVRTSVAGLEALIQKCGQPA